MKKAVRLFWLVFVLAGCALCAAAAEPGTNTPPVDDELVLRAAYPEMPPSFYEQYTLAIWAGGVLLAVAIAGGAWFLTRSRPKPVLPPEVEARRDLREMLERPETGAVLSRVSHVLRHYFERAFDLGTGEMTTAEITLAANNSSRVGPALAASLRDFLMRCDRSKFAPHGPEPPLGAAAEALNLVERGEARLAELRQPETKA
jgi:hypothetical protein